MLLLRSINRPLFFCKSISAVRKPHLPIRGEHRESVKNCLTCGFTGLKESRVKLVPTKRLSGVGGNYQISQISRTGYPTRYLNTEERLSSGE